MKKFKFKLRGLLRIKQAMEKEVKNELLSIQALCAEQQSKIAQTDEKIEDWSKYYNVVMKKGGHSTQLAIIDYHIQGLYRYREQLKISLEVYNRKREDVVKQYDEIRREVKMIEHLHDKQKNEYLVAIGKLEDKINDEMATLRYTRQRMFA